MTGVVVAIVVVVVVALIVFASAFHIVQQYEKGVVFRFGRVTGEKGPGLVAIVPFVNVLRKVSFRIVTMPIQSQGIITRDNVSVDVSAVSYYRVVDATKSVIAIENIEAAINQIAQTTLRKVVGQHTLDEMLAETDKINVDVKEILDLQTADWGVLVTLSLIHISPCHPAIIHPPPSIERTSSLARRARLAAAARRLKSAATRSFPRTLARLPPCLRLMRWPSLRSTFGRVAL